MQESIKAGKVVTLPSASTIADGTAVKTPGSKIFPYVKKNVFVIPQEATFEIQDRVYVYKVNSEGKAESAQVTVFPLNNGKEYIVEDGLQQGETIVAEGAGLIQENTQVATSPVGRQ